MTQPTNILLETGTNELEVIEFMVNFTKADGSPATQSYGINVAKVREIIRMPEITVVPNMPQQVIGVFNMRNQLITALDLRDYLYNERNTSKSPTMIVAEFNNMKFGFMVDAVSRIYRFSWQQVEAPNIINQFAADRSTIVGIIKLQDKNILLLDVEKIIVDIQPELGIGSISNAHWNLGHGRTAVIAEDSPTIRHMIVSQLQSVGFDVRAFENGKQAFEYLNRLQKQITVNPELPAPDVVISDIEMPMMDGYSLTKFIKGTKEFFHVPVILFSSLINDEIRHKGQSVGADAQLTKPEIGILADKIAEIFARNASIAA